MNNIKNAMTDDHRRCDDIFSDVEQAVAAQEWDRAIVAFASFFEAMTGHFTAEEDFLFPAFEAASGMTMGPTQVMRDEHVQMRELMSAARDTLALKDADDYSGNAETLLIMLQQHNMKEENILYPMCDDHLKDQVTTFLSKLHQKLQ
jgi:hemerythrin-like domain-containing protein